MSEIKDILEFTPIGYQTAMNMKFYEYVKF